MRTKHFDEDKNQWHSRKPTQSIRTKTAEKDEGKLAGASSQISHAICRYHGPLFFGASG
jgi:hypothetical protein